MRIMKMTLLFVLVVVFAFGAIAQAIPLEIEKATNGRDADTEPGPYIPLGGRVTWTYEVKNNYSCSSSTQCKLYTLRDIKVTDDRLGSVPCPYSSLAPGQRMTCERRGYATTVGQYVNRATVTAWRYSSCWALDFCFGKDTLGDGDVSHYHGFRAGVDIQKTTNGHDADTPPGPYIPLGDPVTWTYEVQNTGTVPLVNIKVTDDQLGSVPCPYSSLIPSQRMTCERTGYAMTTGLYKNYGMVTANYRTPDGRTGTVPSKIDWSYYSGYKASVNIEKSTNGQDADTPPGPYIPVGDPVTWTYEIQNTGTLSLYDIVVSDDKRVSISCPQYSLAPGDGMDCKGSDPATAGQYANVGMVTARYWDLSTRTYLTIEDSDPSHYLGDSCPDDPAKTEPGVCGCGTPDTDTDNDGTPDCHDGCPDDPHKTDPGMCGCGVADTDSDGDGIADCNDNCPDDPEKTEPGICGCGTPDTDSDSDGTADCNDNCPDTYNPGQDDTDGDGIGDACDELVGDVTISKTQGGGDTVAPGEIFSYTITVQNLSEDAVELMITDALDDYVDYVAGTLEIYEDGSLIGVDEDLIFANDTLNYHTDMLEYLKYLEISFEVKVEDLIEVGSSITNQATVSAFYPGANTPFLIKESEIVSKEVIPEPMTLTLFGLGLFGLLTVVRRRWKRRK